MHRSIATEAGKPTKHKPLTQREQRQRAKDERQFAKQQKDEKKKLNRQRRAQKMSTLDLAEKLISKGILTDADLNELAPDDS